jgi:hypothetical protein
LVDLVYLVSFVQPKTKQTRQTKQTKATSRFSPFTNNEDSLLASCACDYRAEIDLYSGRGDD